MAKGINRVLIGGNVVGDSIRFQTTGNGTACATFKVASDRRGANKSDILTTWIKTNVYSAFLVDQCQSKLKNGVYVIVDGELMNRDSIHGCEVTEVRAREIIFLDE
jgi:single-stranded DNA-binding protein